MKKQFLPILFAAAVMQADFVSSNGKKAFGYTDAQILLRPMANLHSQGIYVRVLGTTGAEKLYAFSYNVSGEHEFFEKSRLISQGGYDARWAANFEETLPQEVLATKVVRYGNVDYNIVENLGVNERPNFEAFVGYEKAYYPTSSGIVYVQPTKQVAGTLAPLSRSGEPPRDANGALKIYTDTSSTQADTAATDTSSVRSWWGSRKTWEKGLIVAGILGLVVLALRKIKI